MNRIEKAINIFLDAINKGVLAKGSCGACAVGNLVASGLGGTVKIDVYLHYLNFSCDKINDAWSILFSTNKGGHQFFCKDNIKDNEVLQNIEATDFTLKELMKIEHAFETNTKILFEDYFNHTKEKIREDQIAGLSAVIKTMMSFEEVKENYVEIFNSKAELILV